MEQTLQRTGTTLEDIIDDPRIKIPPNAHAMPSGIPEDLGQGQWKLEPTKEAKLGREKSFLTQAERDALTQWWLATPNRGQLLVWDAVCECKIDGKDGLILVEAKAHENELIDAAKGKGLDPDATRESFENHLSIGQAIADSAAYLQAASKGRWAISRDLCYQMSNRFAWAWKLASMGIPVVLVYLGFLKANEMSDRGAPFKTDSEWKKAVLEHGKSIVPSKAWGTVIKLENGVPILPLIRSFEIDLPTKPLPAKRKK